MIISGAHDVFGVIATARQGGKLVNEILYDSLKGIIMKSKICGLMIILSCCFVSVSFAQETNFTLVAPDHPALVHSRVDVSIEKNGQLTFQTHGTRLNGKVNFRLKEKVTLLSGDYAGWGYAYSEYRVGKLKGTVYFVFHNDEWQGMLSGDVVGVAQQSTGPEGDMTWRVAKIDQASTQSTVNLTFDRYKPGKQSIIRDVWMPVLPDFTITSENNSTGQYIGAYEQVTTILLLPAPEGNLRTARTFKGGGLEFGTYEAGMESGNLWSFIENTENVDPFNKTRYGTRDGALAGTSEISFHRDADGSTKTNATTIHVPPY